jgi:hypothetical protein
MRAAVLLAVLVLASCFCHHVTGNPNQFMAKTVINYFWLMFYLVSCSFETSTDVAVYSCPHCFDLIERESACQAIWGTTSRLTVMEVAAIAAVLW